MSEPSERLAGHAPALIVGGMRVASNSHAHSPSGASSAPAPKEADPNNNESHDKTSPSKPLDEDKSLTKVHTGSNNVIVINGVEVKLDDAYPTEAMRHMQEKPLPTNDSKSHHKPSAALVQPRKNNY